MKMSPTDIPALIGAFVDQEVAPKASGLQKFMAYAGVFVAQARTGQMLQDPKVREMLAQSGAMDESGMLDVEYLHNMAKFAMEKTGTVMIGGLVLDAGDVEKVYALSKTFAR